MRRFNKMCKLRNTPPHNTVNPTSIPRNSSTHLRSIRHNTRIKHQPNTLPSSLITLRHRTPVAQPQYPPQYYQQVFYDDSVAYYQNMIEIYTQSGNSKRRAGNAMMIGGGIGAGIGGIMMIGALDDIDGDDCRYNDYRCNEDHEDKENIAIAGYLILLGGAGVFIAGVVVKIVGGSKLRKAERFRNSLVQYNYRRQHALQLQIEPLINARKGSYGSRLSLNF